MFKESLFSSKFRDEMASHLNELRDYEAIQLLQRDSSVKVIVTQETYFELLAKARRLEELLGKGKDSEMVDHVSSKDIKSRVLKKAAKLEQQERAGNGNKVGKRSAS